MPRYLLLSSENVILIISALASFVSVAELPEEDKERWEAFISGQLSDTNKRNTVDLVSFHTKVSFHRKCTHTLLHILNPKS